MAKMQCGVKPDILKDALLRGGPWFMSSIPKCFRGACVAAVRVSIHEILDGKASGNIQREVCGWKLFFLLLESNSIAEAGTQAAVRKHRQHVQRRHFSEISEVGVVGLAIGALSELSRTLSVALQHLANHCTRIRRDTSLSMNFSWILTCSWPMFGLQRRAFGHDGRPFAPSLESECDSEVSWVPVWPEERVLRSFGGNPHGTDDSSEEGRWCSGDCLSETSSEDLSLAP